MASLKENNGSLEGLSEVEHLKSESKGLYHPIEVELGQSTKAFTEETVQILKHHGTYQQDDRDVRLELKKKGLEWVFSMMVRTKFPGGRLTAEQYLICDELADKYGQKDMRATSRQDFQFHGVVKGNLRPLIHDLNLLGGMTTLGGCGDVVRNTMAPPVADIDLSYSRCGRDLLALADDLAAKTLPRTKSYFDLWLNDEKVTVNGDGTVTFSSAPVEMAAEPLYGTQYLPRKFKIGIAADFDNSVDVYTQDVGIIACTLPENGGDDSGRIVGYEFLAGGGLGHSHTKPNTYPRLGTPIAFVSEEEVWPLLEAVIRVQRDYGDRSDRKQARLKYTMDRLGIDEFMRLVREYAGRTFPEPRGVKITDQPDYLGWHAQIQPGLNYVGVWVENGRIRDFENGISFKSGLRNVIDRFRPQVRVTPHHNLILAGIGDNDVDAVREMLDQYRIPTDKGIGAIRRMEMACPALPLCPLAQSESERVFPEVMAGLEAAGHGDADVVIRMTGCPNGCARSTTSEIGLVGKGPGRYILYVGGEYNGTRLNQVIDEKLKYENIVPVVSSLLSLWKADRAENERFGDWSHRLGAARLREMLEGAKG